MIEFNLYRINAHYLNYLCQYDTLVPQKSMRPYVAICLEVSGHNYAIPITSNRLRENGKKRNPRTTTELLSKKGTDYGAILYNNMVPIVPEVIQRIDFSKENEISKNMLMGKALLIRKLSSEIKNKAEKVYDLRCSQTDNFINKFCCNYKLLEEKLSEYMTMQNTSKHQSVKDRSTEEPIHKQDIKPMSFLDRALSKATTKADNLNRQVHQEQSNTKRNHINLD